MTLTELRYIVTLAQEMHFGRAATRCHVSQPTLSVAVKKLEDELGVALFERNKSHITVTDLGQRIVEQAQRVLDQVNAIKDMAQAGKDQLKTPLKLGAIYTIGPYLFPHMMPELRRIAPGMPLMVDENFTAVLRQKLRQSELDAVLISLPFNEPEVVTIPLYDEPFVVLMPSDHPLAAYEQIESEQLMDDNVLLLGEGHCFRDQVLEASPCLRERLSQNENEFANKGWIMAQGSSLETLRHMVASGLGITVLPMSASGTARYAEGLLTTRPLAGASAFRTVALAWRVTFPRPNAIDAVREAAGQCRLLEQVNG